MVYNRMISPVRTEMTFLLLQKDSSMEKGTIVYRYLIPGTGIRTSECELRTSSGI